MMRSVDIDIDELFTEVRIGSLVLPNRFVMPAMQRRWVVDGAPAPLLGAYYRRRAEGGVALIIGESAAIDHPSSTQNEHFARLTPDTVEAWRSCVTPVAEAGGHILLQLLHEGSTRAEGGSSAWSRHETVSPSGLVGAGRRAGRALELHEIAEIRDAYIRSARLAQDAGADGVEVHGAHGFLLDQFLWSETNLRDDEYGGADIRARARFPAEVVRGIRAACGPDFAISFRFSQWKTVDYAARIVESPEELAELCEVMRDAGVDAFHVSTRRFWQPEWPDSDLSLAGWTKKVSGVPTIAVGSVGLSNTVSDSFAGEETQAELETGIRLLAERFGRGDFDLVSVGRSLISDADWVLKVQEGRLDDIRGFTRADLRRADDY